MSITPAVVPKPLSEFQKIGHNTYIWTAEKYTPGSAPLITLFMWNAAAAKHIAKYTVAYRKLFPNARILLVRCWTRDMFHRTATYRRLAKPAVDVVKNHIAGDGKILCHSFSNGGGNQVVEFAKAWLEQEGSSLPLHVQILDSSPTKGEWKRSHAAISASLPPTWFWQVIVHVLLLGIFIFEKSTGRGPRMVVLCRELNDARLFDVNTPRLYLYSKADVMVGYEEVEEHAALASAKGWHIKQVRFENSSHAGHIREDDVKYWNAVMEAWNQGPR